jgi:hypothetical protein
MAITYKQIASTTVSALTTTVTFSSIPSTFTDLHIVNSLRGQSNASTLNSIMYFNGINGGVAYSQQNWFYHFGSAGSNISLTNSNIQEMYIPTNSSNVPNAYAAYSIYIGDYASAAPKNIIAHGGFASNSSADSSFRVIGGLWNSTDAITSISFNVTANNFAVDSMFTLYGIKKA